MDDVRFDVLAKALGGLSTRRTSVRVLGGGGIAAALGLAGRNADAKKKKKCKKPKVKCGKKCCDPACQPSLKKCDGVCQECCEDEYCFGDQYCDNGSCHCPVDTTFCHGDYTYPGCCLAGDSCDPLYGCTTQTCNAVNGDYCGISSATCGPRGEDCHCQKGIGSAVHCAEEQGCPFESQCASDDDCHDLGFPTGVCLDYTNNENNCGCGQGEFIGACAVPCT